MLPSQTESSEFDLINRVRHFSNREHPVEFKRTLRNFIQRNVGADPPKGDPERGVDNLLER